MAKENLSFFHELKQLMKKQTNGRATLCKNICLALRAVKMFNSNLNVNIFRFIYPKEHSNVYQQKK
jgi:hypothetical protein